MTKKNKNILIRLDDETKDELEVLSILENTSESDLIRRFIKSVYKRKNIESELLADEILVYIKKERILGKEINSQEKAELEQTIKDILKDDRNTDNIKTLKTLIELKTTEKKTQAETPSQTLDEAKHEKPTREEIDDLKDSVIVFINLNGSTTQKNKIEKIRKASFKNYDEIRAELDKAKIKRSNNSINNLISEILK